MKYTEFPVFPMITYTEGDSPLDKGNKWWEIISIPKGKIRKPLTLNKRSGIHRVGSDWLVVQWNKDEDPISPESHEIALCGTSGDNPPPAFYLGEARIRAMWRGEWATLIEVALNIDLLQCFSAPIKKKRYSGAVVENDRALQIWTQML